MSFRLVPKSVTLNDLDRHVDLWRNLFTNLLYFAVRVRCRRKESSRSLSDLLMSFLLFGCRVCEKLRWLLQLFKAR